MGSRTDRRPPPDPDGLPDDTDLLTLADTDPGAGAQAPPDPALEAELAAFAAMTHRGDPADPAEEQNR